MAVLMLVLGVVLLVIGAELLVRGASKLAIAAGISPLVVGLTVVAYGTSAPELVVSVQAALAEQSDVALGNVVGSNIFNVLFILGISALIVPLRVSQQLVRFDVPIMIGLSTLLLFVAFDGKIGHLDGLMFTTGLMVYTVWTIWTSRREQPSAKVESTVPPEIQEEFALFYGAAVNMAMLVVGLLLLVLGSRALVNAAVTIARLMGVSELVIGLTVVAAGTSLPEVATSVMAAIRGERDIAVGNVVGSSIFNILGVLGLSSLVSPDGVAVPAAALRLDIPIMLAVAIACLPIFFTGQGIARWEGAVFLGYYFAYTISLIIAATDPQFTRTFAAVMFGLVIPLTVLTLLISLVRFVRQSKALEP